MKKDDIKKNEEINENEDIKESRKLSDEELDQVSAAVDVNAIKAQTATQVGKGFVERLKYNISSLEN